MLAGYNRKEFSDFSNISLITLRSWEEPFNRRKGITQKGAKRFIAALSDAGVICTEEWIFNGTQPGPVLKGKLSALDVVAPVTWGEEEAILREINFFYENNPNPVIVAVKDNLMMPYYFVGDYVAGNKKEIKEIKNLVGRNCIVGTVDDVLLRNVCSIDQYGNCLLLTNSIESIENNFIIEQQKIDFVAEIVWHRKRQKQ
jgi:hypothetical protein